MYFPFRSIYPQLLTFPFLLNSHFAANVLNEILLQGENGEGFVLVRDENDKDLDAA
jgi:hypothetical protein